MAEKLMMIALSPTMEMGQIVKWLKKEGDEVKSGDVLCEVETDKTTMEYESVIEGTLLKIILPEGGRARVGDLIGIIGESGENIDDLLTETRLPEKPDDQVSPEPDSVPKETPGVDKEIDRIKASPLARKLAQMKGVDIRNIRGTGPRGRVVKRDIENTGERQVPPEGIIPSMQTSGKDRIVPVSEKRKIIAKRLSESKYNAPHYYLKVKVCMDPIMEARKKLNQKARHKVSLNAFLIKFAAKALHRYPGVNASWQGENIKEFASIDIGFAVAQKDGLITPVVKNLSHKGIIAVEEELKVLIKKARENTLSPGEYTGASFTITSLGSFGINEFTAIINPPGSAILAVGEIIREPVVAPDDNIRIQSNMKMTLSCDHRVIDGALGALFLKTMKDMMEDPIQVLY